MTKKLSASTTARRTPFAGILLAALALWLAAPGFVRAQIYVDAGATGGSNDGTSWANAYTTLQPAINAASAGEQVWVARGTYNPTTDANDPDTSFVMKEGVAIYGGFTSGQMNLTDRDADPASNGTVLSGDIDNDGTKAGNSHHVIKNDNNGLTSGAILDGFTVSGGDANSEDDLPASLTLEYFGGGVLNVVVSPTITNCRFQGNSAISGGAVFNGGGSPDFSNCSFQENAATSDGGAVYNFRSASPGFTDCSFRENTASRLGGAVFTTEASNPDFGFIGCLFQENNAQSGGAVYIDNFKTTFTNCLFQKNNATENGGACAGPGSTSDSYTNCAFQENAARNGGAIYNGFVSNGPITNCSFQGNTATENGGAIATADASQDFGSIELVNSVFWDNGGANSIAVGTNRTIIATYSLFDESVTGYTNGGNNLTTDTSPFVSSSSTKLRSCSLAIDAGNDAANNTETDLAGEDRKVRTIDMGACEFQGTQLVATTGPDQSVVFGFKDGDNCTDLTATASGGSGSGYTYLWDNGAGSGAAVNVCPETTTTYQVTATDNNGCTATDEVTVNVQDVRCGNKMDKVEICYYGVSQCVPEKIAKRYLRLGATLGSCGSSAARIGYEEQQTTPLQLSLKAYPNPIQDAVTVEVLAPNAGRGTFEVLDLTGVARQSRTKYLQEGLNEVVFRLGSLPTGVYLIRAIDSLNQQGVVRVSKE